VTGTFTDDKVSANVEVFCDTKFPGVFFMSILLKPHLGVDISDIVLFLWWLLLQKHTCAI